MTAEIPNAFVQTDINASPNGEHGVMNISGKLVDMLVVLDSHTYNDYVKIETELKFSKWKC